MIIKVTDLLECVRKGQVFTFIEGNPATVIDRGSRYYSVMSSQLPSGAEVVVYNWNPKEKVSVDELPGRKIRGVKVHKVSIYGDNSWGAYDTRQNALVDGCNHRVDHVEVDA